MGLIKNMPVNAVLPSAIPATVPCDSMTAWLPSHLRPGASNVTEVDDWNIPTTSAVPCRSVPMHTNRSVMHMSYLCIHWGQVGNVRLCSRVSFSDTLPLSIHQNSDSWVQWDLLQSDISAPMHPQMTPYVSSPTPVTLQGSNRSMPLQQQATVSFPTPMKVQTVPYWSPPILETPPPTPWAPALLGYAYAPVSFLPVLSVPMWTLWQFHDSCLYTCTHADPRSAYLNQAIPTPHARISDGIWKTGYTKVFRLCRSHWKDSFLRAIGDINLCTGK